MPAMKTSEKDLIRRVRAAASIHRDSGIRLGIGDDAALLVPRHGYETILSSDWFLEGTHFLRDRHRADSIGWKCLARAVSDIAAMGGGSRCFLLSLAIPETHTGQWLDQFLAGLRRAARKFKCPLAGGDTTRYREILINVTVVGEVRTGRALLRSGARPDDIIFVSGRLGEAELGLERLHGKKRIRKGDPTWNKHLYPVPRISLGRWLAEDRIATAMMDLSDGLSSDLPRLCEASGVGARLEASRIPTVVPNRSGLEKIELLDLALHGGDDYELLFTVHPGKTGRLPRSFEGIPLTAIGTITTEPNLTLVPLDGKKQALPIGGWDPFRHAKRNQRSRSFGVRKNAEP
jgi:thiamine-monophosphate kinase